MGPYEYESLSTSIIYVDASASGNNDGTSWENAYNYLQDALADADLSIRLIEIRVAEGIYRPDKNSIQPDGTGARDVVFQLINGVTLKGAYAGLSTADPNARDFNRPALPGVDPL